MKRYLRGLLILFLITSALTPIESFAVVSSNPVEDCSAGSTCSVTFTYASDYYAWTVPTGVNSIDFDIKGAQGGSGISGATGGSGGRVVGTLTTTPGSILYFYVGGKGSDGVSSAYSTGGYNGGGNGAYDTSYPSSYSGGAGGGASDIRTSASGTGYTNRLVVAGGGGGGSGGCTGTGGGGGGTTGVTGTLCGSAVAGGGGTQSAGGTAETSRGSTRGSLGVGGSAGARIAYGSGGGGGGYYGGGAGSSTQDHGSGWGAGGGGGSSYTHPSLVTTFTHTQSSQTGNGVITVTYIGAPVVSTFTTSQTTPTNISTAGTISFTLTMSQSVTGMVSGDFQFGDTSTCNAPVVSGSGSSYTVTVTNCSEGLLKLQLKAGSVTGTIKAGPPALSTAKLIQIDRAAPTISSVTAPTNKTYIPSETPTFTVNFSESVTVTGTPRLTLTVGSLTKYATFLSMSDSKTASFRYTVGTSVGEFDTDGISVSTTLDLNGGAIADLATNALSPLTFTAPTLTSVLVAQPASAPTITSITATSTQLDVYFTAGASNGSAITNYQYSTNNGSTWTNRSPTATTSPISITGLVNGTAYTVRIRAINGAGSGDSSTAVIETPTAVSVTGDSTLVLTYGNIGTTSAYGATGGTGTYSWSLGSVISGVTLQGTAVQASASTPAGTYTQTVRATDGNLAVGTKTLTITVNKASTSISIALPNSATDAALGGAITITATVPRAGSVNFMLGGSTLSGCGSAAAASTTATCSWTPGALGSVSLTATFTPTDSSNYETATTTTLTITVVNGVSTVSLSLTGGVTQTPKGQAINIIAAINQSGKVSFFIDGKRIPKCFNLNATAGNKTCSWIPTVQRQVTITVTLDPTNAAYDNSSSALKVWVLRRSGLR